MDELAGLIPINLFEDTSIPSHLQQVYYYDQAKRIRESHYLDNLDAQPPLRIELVDDSSRPRSK